MQQSFNFPFAESTRFLKPTSFPSTVDEQYWTLPKLSRIFFFAASSAIAYNCSPTSWIWSSVTILVSVKLTTSTPSTSSVRTRGGRPSDMTDSLEHEMVGWPSAHRVGAALILGRMNPYTNHDTHKVMIHDRLTL